MGLLSALSDPERAVRAYDGCVKIMDRLERPLDLFLMLVFVLALIVVFVDDAAWTTKLLFLLFPVFFAFTFAGTRRWLAAGIRMELTRCDEGVRQEFGHYLSD